jgi:hypothetical protein
MSLRKRMAIALALAAVFGYFCALGTSAVEIPGFEATLPYLLTVFYSRLMMGFTIGFAGGVKLLKGEARNAALRGAVIGGIVSVGIAFYGGAAVLIPFGMVYGLLTDLIATKAAS